MRDSEFLTCLSSYLTKYFQLLSEPQSYHQFALLKHSILTLVLHWILGYTEIMSANRSSLEDLPQHTAEDRFLELGDALENLDDTEQDQDEAADEDGEASATKDDDSGLRLMIKDKPRAPYKWTITHQLVWMKEMGRTLPTNFFSWAETPLESVATPINVDLSVLTIELTAKEILTASKTLHILLHLSKNHASSFPATSLSPRSKTASTATASKAPSKPCSSYVPQHLPAHTSRKSHVLTNICTEEHAAHPPHPIHRDAAPGARADQARCQGLRQDRCSGALHDIHDAPLHLCVRPGRQDPVPADQLR